MASSGIKSFTSDPFPYGRRRVVTATAASAVAHSRATWHASLRHCDIAFNTLLVQRLVQRFHLFATALIFAVSGELAVNSALYS